MTGVGCDIIEIQRLENASKNPRFLSRVFTEEELDYYRLKGQRAETLAGMFAAKEAVFKALNTSYKGFYFQLIQITHCGSKPFVRLAGALKEAAESVSVSISHCALYAMAAAVAASK